MILNQVIKNISDWNQSAIWCFNFHQVADYFEPGKHMKGTFVKMRTFEKYIKYFRKHFDLIDVKTAFELQKNRRFKGKYACITFDDGDVGIEYIIKYLLSECIPVSFFLNSAYIGSNHADPLRVANYLMHNNVSSISKKRLVHLTKTLRMTMLRSEFQKAKEELRDLKKTIPMEETNFNVSFNFLRTIDSPFINFGLHGHEHDRFILMDYSEQKKSISENIKFISRLKGYIPVFAIPFGRPWDWNGTTIDVCNEMRLDFLFADGGINTGEGEGLKRIPADNRSLLCNIRLGFY